MVESIKESDWKQFRRLQNVALERYCDRVLSDVGRVVADSARSSHARYLELFKLLERRDRELGRAFNDPRRSVALIQLAAIRSLGLLTDDEFATFSPEMCEVVTRFIEATR